VTETVVAAVLGGSGFTHLYEAAATISVTTPYGDPSHEITVCEIAGVPVAFLPRHGERHQHAPHRVNYRANLWALRALGARVVLAPFAAGALDRSLTVGDIVVPDQLVDRTWGRADTFHDDFAEGPVHAPFADPYDGDARRLVLDAAARTHVAARDGATVVVIQGPRFGTRAESEWYAQQGWHLVNMTQYPEAVLARELRLQYAGIALVTDADTGDAPGDGVTQEEVFTTFDEHLDRLRALVVSAIGDL
jgi:5'-methylthioadenosine phosphorylase